MTAMTPAVYRSICGYARNALCGFVPRPVSLLEAYELPYDAAVYIAVDYLGEVDYVGSTVRQGNRPGLELRVGEHLRRPERNAVWWELWIVPLHPKTPKAGVRSIEGMIGRDLRPKNSLRLPRNWV